MSRDDRLKQMSILRTLPDTTGFTFSLPLLKSRSSFVAPYEGCQSRYSLLGINSAISIIHIPETFLKDLSLVCDITISNYNGLSNLWKTIYLVAKKFRREMDR